MPNWAEGSLKIRGTKEDVRKFLTGALKPCDPPFAFLRQMNGEEIEKPLVTIEEDEYDFSMKAPNGFYVDGCRRAFIESGINWYFDDADTDTETLVIDDFKQAWGIDPEPFVHLSKKFNVDIKIYVFERGMEFNHDVEIHKGVLIKSNVIQFDDYRWDCVLPNIGG